MTLEQNSPFKEFVQQQQAQIFFYVSFGRKLFTEFILLETIPFSIFWLNFPTPLMHFLITQFLQGQAVLVSPML